MISFESQSGIGAWRGTVLGRTVFGAQAADTMMRSRPTINRDMVSAFQWRELTLKVSGLFHGIAERTGAPVLAD